MTEHDIQSTFIAWCRAQRDPRLAWVHSSLNGVRTSPSQARRAKQSGMLAGVADVFIPYPSGGLHGMWIEFKCGRNGCTAEQTAFGEYAQAAGYRWVVCRSVDEAVTAVERYLEGSNGQKSTS